MDVLIFGGGAVGLGIASCLIKAGIKTTILARPDTVAALKQKGLRRTGILGDFHAQPKEFLAISDIDKIKTRQFDFILVCTKSNQTHVAAEEISKHIEILKDNGKIIHFQNGWGNAEKILEFFPESTVYTARVITGFIRPHLNHVQITVHADAVHIGSLFAQSLNPIEAVCQSIREGGLPCISWNDIQKDLWAKMLYNCALNPLGAVLNVPYGQLADDKNTRSIMNEIIEEAYQVMAATGYTTYWDTAEEYMKAFYGKLVPSTAAHRSSTLQDIIAGKPTEIDALTGQILQLAEKYRIETPVNRILYKMIRFLEMQTQH